MLCSRGRDVFLQTVFDHEAVVLCTELPRGRIAGSLGTAVFDT